MNDGVDAMQLNASNQSQQFLTFCLSQQEFGIEILRVQEIRNYSRVTPIPNAPANVRGVMNLRGTVIPIVDLRATLSMQPTDYDKFTVIIVVNLEDKVLGLVVDSVSDVLDFRLSDIEKPPTALVDSARDPVVQGIAKTDDRLISLLDIQSMIFGDYKL